MFPETPSGVEAKPVQQRPESATARPASSTGAVGDKVLEELGGFDAWQRAAPVLGHVHTLLHVVERDGLAPCVVDGSEAFGVCLWSSREAELLEDLVQQFGLDNLGHCHLDVLSCQAAPRAIARSQAILAAAADVVNQLVELAVLRL